MHQVDFNELRQRVISPVILTLADYWEELRQGRAMPFRSELDPARFRKALSRVWLIECSDIDNLLHRLVGEDIQERWGKSLTGKTIEELYDAQTVTVMRSLAGQIKTAKCVLQGVSLSVGTGGHRRNVERIALPFAEDDPDTVAHILGCSEELEMDAATRLHMEEFGARFDVENAVFYIPAAG